MRERLNGEFTVEQAIMILRGLKCKIYEDHLIVQETTKNQKKIFELSSIIVPTSVPGI